MKFSILFVGIFLTLIATINCCKENSDCGPNECCARDDNGSPPVCAKFDKEGDSCFPFPWKAVCSIQNYHDQNTVTLNKSALTQ